MEKYIIQELEYVIEELQRREGNPFDIEHLLTHSVSNITAKIVFGSRFDYTAEQLENLQFDEFFEKNRPYQVLRFLRVSSDPFDHVSNAVI